MKDLDLGEVTRRLGTRRIMLVAPLAQMLGVHPNTIRWRVTVGRYRAECYGERQTFVLTASVLEDLRRLNPEMEAR